MDDVRYVMHSIDILYCVYVECHVACECGALVRERVYLLVSDTVRVGMAEGASPHRMDVRWSKGVISKQRGHFYRPSLPPPSRFIVPFRHSIDDSIDGRS